MRSGGVKLWAHGKSGLVILMMYGSTGQMMDLVSLSSFKWVSCFYLNKEISQGTNHFNLSNSADLVIGVDLLQLAEDLGASPVWVANSGNNFSPEKSYSCGNRIRP